MPPRRRNKKKPSNSPSTQQTSPSSNSTTGDNTPKETPKPANTTPAPTNPILTTNGGEDAPKPSSVILKQKTKQKNSQAPPGLLTLASRPTHKPIGKPRECFVNHFFLEIGTPCIYQYRVTFEVSNKYITKV